MDLLAHFWNFWCFVNIWTYLPNLDYATSLIHIPFWVFKKVIGNACWCFHSEVHCSLFASLSSFAECRVSGRVPNGKDSMVAGHRGTCFQCLVKRWTNRKRGQSAEVLWVEGKEKAITSVPNFLNVIHFSSSCLYQVIWRNYLSIATLLWVSAAH
jgi:hypothetical protein